MSLFALRAPVDLALPPGFSAVALRELGDAFAHAHTIADAQGAGTLVWVRRFDVAEFAVILEPDTALREARKSFFIGMNAMLQAVASHCPPERSVSFDWPDALRFNAGLVGGGRLGWPAHCAEDEVPDWLIFGGIVRVALPGMADPGATPDAAALEDEGFEGAGPSVLIESFARFLMLQVDVWRGAGYGPILADYLGHLDKERAGDALSFTGEGDLRVVSLTGVPERIVPLVPALQATAWLDRDSGAPRL